MPSLISTILISVLILILTQTTTSAILEAPVDKIWFGAWLNVTDSYEGANDGDSPLKFNERMGFNSPVFHFAQPLPNPNGDKTKVPIHLMQETHTDAVAFLTILPSSPWTLSDEEIQQLFDQCQELARDQRRVLVRFGTEMNGSWFPWGQRPVAFIKLWKRMYAAFKPLRFSVQFVWAPNFGQGYPFGDNLFALPEAGTEEFIALDTNSDGAIDAKDDPYSPYYPGDDFVDWVGMSVYYFGPAFPWTVNAIPGGGDFEEKLTYFDFYNTYAVKPNKPMMISETAAAYHVDTTRGPGDGELAIKQAWWRQYLTNTTFLETYSQIKSINIFEFLKHEESTTRDYRISYNDEVRNAFLGDFNATRSKFAFAHNTGVKIRGFGFLAVLSVIAGGVLVV